MDRNEAASVIQRFLTCRDIRSDDCCGHCETCRYNTEYDETTEALKLAIKTLGKDIDVPSKWIPVSERLPEEGQGCLVCDKGQILIDTFIGHGNPYNWRWYVRDYEAWMPLPEPYKEGEEHDSD